MFSKTWMERNKEFEKLQNKDCELCGLETEGYDDKWIYTDKEKDKVTLILETSEWSYRCDGYETIGTDINYCPECGKSAKKILEEEFKYAKYNKTN